MPVSRKRKKDPVKNRKDFVPKGPEAVKPNPNWWTPTMVTLMVVGLLWVVTTYLTAFKFPLPFLAPLAAGNGNLIVGFVLLISGFLMTLRWR